MTQSYVNDLRKAILTRTDRVNHLTNMVKESRSRYSIMTLPQLNEAIRDVVGMRKEIEEHKEFIAKARKEIASFYAPVA